MICSALFALPALPYVQLWEPDALLQIQIGGSSSLNSYWEGAITTLELGLGTPNTRPTAVPLICLVYFGDQNLVNLDPQRNKSGLDCLVCNTGWVRYNETCMTSCLEGTLATAYYACAVCYEGCNTCSSLDNTGCTACTDGWEPLPQTSTVNSSGCFKINKCGECDDGNKIDGDGCNSSCQIEAGWYCVTNQFGLSDCQQCDPFCANCSPQIGCTDCLEHYVLISQSCYLYGNQVEGI